MGILNAYREFRDSNPAYKDVALVLSGIMGWRNDTLSQHINAHPYRDDILFAGYVDLNDMPSLYYHAQCFVYLSFYEGFGIPILEAMKSGCPVICSNTSSMPEVIGSAGEQVDPKSPEQAAHALSRILDDSAYADSLRFAGLQRGDNFSWRKHVDDLTAIYRQI
jgi:glycosyltransferase involved in cell wall biosynthesis